MHLRNLETSLLGLIIALSPLAYGVDLNLGKTLNLAAGLNTGFKISPNYTENDQALLLKYIYEAKPTAIIPLFYDVEPQNLGTYKHLMANLTAGGIPFYPMVGNYKSSETINTADFRGIAKGYAAYTKSINFGSAAEYFDHDESDFTAFIEYLINTLKFEHIQLNPWPGSWKSPYTEVDSAFDEVQPAPNWTPNTVRFLNVINANPGVRIVTNYEDPPEEVTLAGYSQSKQIATFQTTINAIQKDFSAAKGQYVSFTPPWSSSYQPPNEGTWSWLLNNFYN